MKQKEVIKLFRRRRRRRIVGLAAGVILLLMIVLLSLRFQSVTIEGTDRYTAEEVESMIFDDIWSRNPVIFFFRERFGVHKTIPFVDKYKVILTGLRSAEIILYEKKIVGYVNRMGCYMYFDQNGYVVESSQEPMENVPGVVGLSTSYIILGEKLPVEDQDLFQEILSISQFLQSNTVKWRGKEQLLVNLIETIDLDKSKCVTLSVDRVHVYLGNHIDMEEKLQEMSSILPNLSGKSGTLYLDTYRSTVSNPSYVFK